jgi:hypothetical protein
MGHGTEMERGGPGNGDENMARPFAREAPRQHSEGIENRRGTLFLNARRDVDTDLKAFGRQRR